MCSSETIYTFLTIKAILVTRIEAIIQIYPVSLAVVLIYSIAIIRRS